MLHVILAEIDAIYIFAINHHLRSHCCFIVMQLKFLRCVNGELMSFPRNTRHEDKSCCCRASKTLPFTSMQMLLLLSNEIDRYLHIRIESDYQFRTCFSPPRGYSWYSSSAFTLVRYMYWVSQSMLMMMIMTYHVLSKLHKIICSFNVRIKVNVTESESSSLFSSF